ncbi:DUF1441 family protein [Polaromonas sp.]|uniref:DUF1441 family protein n=1 Tax=Polaromonas sp. TaxID=1869339 RepID=UPI002D7A1F65|nr:DUF1441 family protein [Polaromonas sp.]
MPVAQLAVYLGITERRIQQLAADNEIPPGEDGRYWLLESTKGYLAYLQKAAQGKAVSDDGKKKQGVQIELLQAQRDTAQMELDKKRGFLLPIDQVRDSTVRLLKILTEGADSLPDLLERKAGASGAVLNAVGEVCDQWRLRLFERATEILGGEVPAAFTPQVAAGVELEPEAATAAPAKKKRGRPRKVRPDSFTPPLI